MRMVTINALQACPRLAALHLYDCDTLQHVGTVANCTALTSLTMTDFQHGVDTSFLTAFPKLKLLNLSGCTLRTDASFLASLTVLDSLDLACCEYTRDLAPLYFLHCSVTT